MYIHTHMYLCIYICTCIPIPEDMWYFYWIDLSLFKAFSSRDQIVIVHLIGTSPANGPSSPYKNEDVTQKMQILSAIGRINMNWLKEKMTGTSKPWFVMSNLLGINLCRDESATFFAVGCKTGNHAYIPNQDWTSQEGFQCNDGTLQEMEKWWKMDRNEPMTLCFPFAGCLSMAVASMGPFGYPKKPNGCGSQVSTPQNECFRFVQEGFKLKNKKKTAGIALGKLEYYAPWCWHVYPLDIKHGWLQNPK